MSLTDLLHRRRQDFEQRLFELLAIPSVSTDPARSAEVERCAYRVLELLQEAGLEAQLLPTGGHPAVVGWWRGRPGAPTALIYGHYDVQPEDPVELWTSPPFTPTVRKGLVYARGATDDKGQVLAHVMAVAALLEQDGALPVNLVMLIEGEEEIGSRHLPAFVRQHRDLLRADLLVVSDGSLAAPGRPSLVYGMRGAAGVQIDLQGGLRDLPGGPYDGCLVNPGFELLRLLAALRGPGGRVAVPGFYDQVREVSAQERRELSAHPFLAPSRALFGEEGYSPQEQRTIRPTLELNGLLAGGGGLVLPATAMAKLTCRLVPDQVPQEIVDLVSQRIRELAPANLSLSLMARAGGRPWTTPRDHPALQAAARALERVYGQPAVFLREGGTIPIVAEFQDTLGLPPVLMGFGLETDNLHAPDEHFALENYHLGIRASAEFLLELGTFLSS